MTAEKYYFRVRYHGSSRGAGPWSPAKSITIVKPDVGSLVEKQRFQASDYAMNAYFGWSAALSADGLTLVIGATLDDTPLVDAGAIYLFQLENGLYVQKQKLVPTDSAKYDAFGRSVDISSDGSRIISGSYGKDGVGVIDTGAAYVFLKTGALWVQETKFTAPDPGQDDMYGYAVALSGDGLTAAVGAHLNDDFGLSSGSLYLYAFRTGVWTYVGKISPTDLTDGDQYGCSVELNEDGTMMAVGAYKNQNTYLGDGSVYLYRRVSNTWTFEKKIQPALPSYNANFGQTVKLSANGQRVFVSAYRDSSQKGAVYVYEYRNGDWVEQQKLVASDAAAGDNFGFSLTCSSTGDVVLIGAHLARGAYAQMGAAYLFALENDRFVQKKKLCALDAVANHNFGRAVALDATATHAVITATGFNTVVACAYHFS